MEKNVRKANQRKKLKVYIPLTLVMLIVLTISFLWYREYSKYISTDDAHVDSDNVSVSAKMLGRIARVYVDEGDSIKQGQLLAELDSSDLLAQKQQAIAMKAQAATSKVQAQAKLQYDEENIKVLQVNYEKAQDDLNRAKNQFAGDVIPKEQYDHAKKAFESAKAQIEAAKSQLNVSKAQIGSALASVKTAQAQLGIVSTQLGNTKLYASINGIVAKRWLLAGDIAQPGQSIYTITNNHKLWIIVYLEETKMAGIHLNQNVRFTIDAFPGVNFIGRIFTIGSNTASQFSLIPPNNASGNFTKTTQRVPIKISIDGTDKKENPAKYKMLAGMSAVVKIIKD
ncbi:MAG: HlyD family secretion protein [Bacteroidota bacterium]|nr:HlyD family secretion protein [Bacteroidota bacterium]